MLDLWNVGSVPRRHGFACRRAGLPLALTLALTLVLGGGCTNNYRAEFHPPPAATSDPGAHPGSDPTATTSLATTAPFVKLHTHAGELLVLDRWDFDEAAGQVRGRGLRYSAERELLREGELELAYAEVALVETNTPERVTHATSLAIMGVVGASTIGGALFCAANPKACFGSCPTFYVRDGEALELRAEGFSSAVAAALEQRDLDHLGVVDPGPGRFELVMANEAYETHFLRRVELLSVARPDPSAEVFHARAGFVSVRDRLAPTRCRGLAGDCLAAVSDVDALEYSSTASAEDLATREQIELEFGPAPAGRELALVIRARNTLLDTFLFYQGLAYMGAEAATWILRVDRQGAEGPLAELLRGFDRALGDVEVEVWDGQGWGPVGSFSEYGPIAHETQAIVIPAAARAQLRSGSEPVRVRLVLTRGRWKLDAISLGESLGPLTALTLAPEHLSHSQGATPVSDPEGLATLLDPNARLLSYPGDVWTLAYTLPEGPQSLFLRAEGFYWEWPREDWLAEQSALEAARFFADPRQTLRRLAPVYAAIEGELEPVFWQTRIQPLPLAGTRERSGAQP
jgi:hypothetical protein